ncbi:MAG: MurR/RpiR family transcriptional regulator [Oliverpabstia sp.]
MKKNYDNSVIQTIEAKYDSFTSTEKAIAEFFINNTEKMDFSIKSVAAHLYVSTASLSRFTKKCGYKGYREFIYEYEVAFMKNETIETGDHAMVFGIYQEFLNKSYSLIDKVQIMRITKYINNAERVYVLGKGSSGISATEMELRFIRVGVNIDSIVDPDRMRIQSVFWNNHNLVLGISISGNTTDVSYGLKEAHHRGAKTVLLTTKHDDSFNEYCDEVLFMPNIGRLDRGNLISPQFPVLILIDVLYFYFVKSDKLLKENLHSETVWSLCKRNKEVCDERKS